MHLAQAQLRAIETGRYVVRAGSTGISAMITPTGKIIASQAALQEGIVYGEVSLCDEMTLYTRVGNLLVWLCMGYAVGLLALGTCYGIYERKKRQLPKESS